MEGNSQTAVPATSDSVETMAEDNPQISVSFLRTYSALDDVDDEQLQSAVDMLKKEWIETKGALQRVSRNALRGKIPALLLDALKPEGKLCHVLDRLVMGSVLDLVVHLLLNLFKSSFADN